MDTRPKRFNELWITEEQSPDMKLSLRVSDVLLNVKSPYQDILLVDTGEYGRMMILDGAIQITERDEFCYSEMMAHVALSSHPDPKRVLIVGGGDGGVLREVLRHKNVEKATLIDIDEDVINASKRFLPTISAALEDPRADVKPMDAMVYIKAAKEEFDIAIVDSTDPVEFAAGLFESPFYRDIHRPEKGRNGRCPDRIALHGPERRPGRLPGNEFRLPRRQDVLGGHAHLSQRNVDLHRGVKNRRPVGTPSPGP